MAGCGDEDLTDQHSERLESSTSSSTDEETEAYAVGSYGKTAGMVGNSLQIDSTEDRKQLEDDNEQAQQLRREQNIRALQSNSLSVTRQPVLSKFLSLKESDATLRRPFTSPKPGVPAASDALRKRLLARRKFVPWGDTKPLPAVTVPRPPPEQSQVLLPPKLSSAEQIDEELPDDIEPLVLWEPPDGIDEEPLTVDNMLVRFLRPHQREGVQFMFECVTGLRLPTCHAAVPQRLPGFAGCILADDMGLGKTLQGITLLWTLLCSGHALLGGCPLAKRAIIVCPTSLVSNWDSECQKWLKGRLRTLPLCESSREDVIDSIIQFLHPANVYKVLIISYETFRLHAERFRQPGACDLLICDEAHRLKNDATLTNKALDSLLCSRRVLLSGTPMQNHLDEFYAMVEFCNPGVLGTPAEFRKQYENPILAGREPDAAAEIVARGEERSAELSALVNNFILRRTNTLLSQHLPPKVVQVVCCRLTELQQQLYTHFLESKAARKMLAGRTAGVLSAITSLKKLCNHPKLIYDAANSKQEDALSDGFKHVHKLFPPGVFDNGRTGRGGMAVGWENLSGKLAVLARMLHLLYTETDDRIVIVSNYTQTLDLIAGLCRERNYPFVRLDGSTSINKRQKLVQVFNDLNERQFVFLLSSKAGGCGLNLVGGNRLILFDPDWNPATDKQAAARVWRDGQQKRVYVYRFLATGTIEEKVFQRQISKEGLQQLVSKNGKAAANLMSTDELRQLFALHPDTVSDTYDMMCCGGEKQPDEQGAQPILKEQAGAPAEEDLKNWGHHTDVSTVPDIIMQKAAGVDVTFIFTCQVEGRAVKEPAPGSHVSRHQHPHAGAKRHAHAGTRSSIASLAGRPPLPVAGRILSMPHSASSTPKPQPAVHASAAHSEVENLAAPSSQQHVTELQHRSEGSAGPSSATGVHAPSLPASLPMHIDSAAMAGAGTGIRAALKHGLALSRRSGLALPRPQLRISTCDSMTAQVAKRQKLAECEAALKAANVESDEDFA